MKLISAVVFSVVLMSNIVVSQIMKNDEMPPFIKMQATSTNKTTTPGKNCTLRGKPSEVAFPSLK